MKAFFPLLSFLGVILGFSPVSVHAQELSNKLDQYFEKARQDWNVPGMAIGVIKDGEIILAKGYGNLEDGKDTAVDGNSLFAIASNTKAFTAAAISILVDEGKLSWDDPVQKYLPYFRLYDEYVSQHTTIRDLLCHRVGLGTFSGDVIWYKHNLSAEEIVRRAAEVPQAYEFRAGYGYSNLMFITAGEVIKAVSGKDWDAFLKEKVFDPLEMERTITSTNNLKKLKNVASPHKIMPGTDENPPISWVNWDNMGAAGGIISSVNDMLKWLQLQLNEGKNGDQVIFSESAQATFWQPHNPKRVSKFAKDTYFRSFSAYGLGWSIIDYRDQVVYNHGGGYDGMYSKVAVVPEQGFAMVILTNSMTGISSPLLYYTLDLVLDEEPKDWSSWGLERTNRWDERNKKRMDDLIESRKMDTEPSLSLENYAGNFQCKMYGNIEVKFENDQLRLLIEDAPDLSADLSHWHYDTFKIEWDQTHAWFDFGTLQFLLDNNANVVELKFDVPNNDIFFHEIQAVKVKVEDDE